MTPDEQTRFLALVEHAKATCVVKIVQRVAEIPDRTSPDDQPDIMLVTGGELGQIVSDELEALVHALGTEPKRLLVVTNRHIAPAAEYVHHLIDCPAIGGNGDSDCRCGAVQFLDIIADQQRQLSSALSTIRALGTEPETPTRRATPRHDPDPDVMDDTRVTFPSVPAQTEPPT